MEEKLTTNDVARMLGLAPATVLYYCKTNRLKAERTKSGIRLFDRREVERFAQSREKATGIPKAKQRHAQSQNRNRHVSNQPATIQEDGTK